MRKLNCVRNTEYFQYVLLLTVFCNMPARFCGSYRPTPVVVKVSVVYVMGVFQHLFTVQVLSALVAVAEKSNAQPVCVLRYCIFQYTHNATKIDQL